MGASKRKYGILLSFKGAKRSGPMKRFFCIAIKRIFEE
jgi:hypothetical protein